MKELAENNYNRFDLFRNQWAVVTAGTIDNFNGCTVSWGSMGTLWTRGGETGMLLLCIFTPVATLAVLWKTVILLRSAFFRMNTAKHWAMWERTPAEMKINFLQQGLHLWKLAAA